MDELLSEFVAETQESLEALANVVVALESDPSDRNLLDELFRFFHTVKGSCGFLNLPRFEKLSHAAEDILSEVRSGDAPPDAATITAVLAVMDRIAELCSAIASGASLPHQNDDQLIETLRHCYKMACSEAAPAVDDDHVEKDSAIVTEQAVRNNGASRTIRLPLTLIDQLMNGVSDMVLARNELSRKLRTNDASPELEAAFDRLSTCIADMRDSISKTRMQRVDRLFMAIPRMVRDLGRELGKSIELTLEGGDVEMDREMVEMVVDPLTHIVRNSIDHGIEKPIERAATGKPETGTLRISAHQSGSQIVIEVADDGRGINVDAVIGKVVAKGLMTAQDVSKLNDQAKLDLIFTPGLSTAEQVTSVSGRGVGMDIVRANIERIGGVISLSNDPGQGLTITMRVPLTLTIIPGLILSAGGLNFAIPRSAIIEILHDNNPTVSLSALGGGKTVTIRGTRYSMIDLEDVIGVPPVERQGPRSLMLVRSASGKPYILGVSHVENHEELVIRPAAPIVMSAGIYAGMTLPDNGQPMLLLDAGGIAQAAQLPLVVENVDVLDTGETDEQASPKTYTGLRFIELTGEERVVRLSLVERVEDIDAGAFGETAGRAHVQIDGRLIPCAYGIDKKARTGVITCLRMRDGARELCYPVETVVDIDEIPTELDMDAAYGVVAGVVLVAGQHIEVIDGYALFSTLQDGQIVEEKASKGRCVIADGDDIWNREILAPLLMQAGYDVIWGEADLATGGHDVLLMSGAGTQAGDVSAAHAVVKLRSSSAPAGPDDDSIYRYDRSALLNAISLASGIRSSAA
ncbi:MAG: chemotaxis protein CheA [Sphingobium sp.]|nr:chemotaxis protein CheA [Sphingobium sp.]MCP5399800.1 chemotaxis protein CheA [Sphingomonas sp.]